MSVQTRRVSIPNAPFQAALLFRLQLDTLTIIYEHMQRQTLSQERLCEFSNGSEAIEFNLYKLHLPVPRHLLDFLNDRERL
jgi:hypothetical protein